MTQKQSKQPRKLVRVTDQEGNEFICPLHALRDPDELSDEEKARCIEAHGPRGLVSPL
ncbi:MAG: hypothetical protein WBG37_12990 [Desulfobacterales bacterium]|jgi:hypothetical protein